MMTAEERQASEERHKGTLRELCGGDQSKVDAWLGRLGRGGPCPWCGKYPCELLGASPQAKPRTIETREELMGGEIVVTRDGQLKYGPGVCAVCDFRKRWCPSCTDQRDAVAAGLPDPGPLARERAKLKSAMAELASRRGGDGDLRPIGEVLSEMYDASTNAIQVAIQTREERERSLNYEADRSWETEKTKMPEYMLKRGVPSKLVSDIAKGLFETQALLAVERWKETAKTTPLLSLTLTGDPQVGKSLALAYGLSTRTRTVKTQYGGPQTEYMKSRGMEAEPWITWTKWDLGFLWLKASTLSSMDRFDRDAQAKLREYESVPMLVLDELGGGNIAPDAETQKRIDNLICKRDDAGLQTWLTTNYRTSELRSKLGDRVFERLSLRGQIVECGSWRETLI